jgi:hypothetical protein
MLTAKHKHRRSDFFFQSKSPTALLLALKFEKSTSAAPPTCIDVPSRCMIDFKSVDAEILEGGFCLECEC